MKTIQNSYLRRLNFLRNHSVRVFLGSIIAAFIPLKKQRVAIVVNHRVPFSGNLTIVADELIKRGRAEVLIYKDGPIPGQTVKALRQAGALVLTKFSIRHLITLLRSSTIILGHGIGDAYITHARKGRRIVNVWHGVTLKRIGLLVEKGSAPQNLSDKQIRRMKKDGALYDYMVASNPRDQKIMAEAFDMPLEKVLDCGLPRFDYLRYPDAFSAEMQTASNHLRDKAQQQKIIAYTPTFREKTGSPLAELDGETLDNLTQFCTENGYKIAIRPHPYDLAALDSLLARVDGDFIIDASSRVYPEAAVLMQNAHILITDYSSIWVDYLFTKRPIFALVPDLEHYITDERGFINDFSALLPGPVCHNWGEVLEEIVLRINKQLPSKLEAAEQSKRILSNEQLLPQNAEHRYTEQLFFELAQEDEIFGSNR